ncbi:hypothetical protein ILUMI_15301 [Ignelater luminosus]|uniref:Amidophosphoribosyltransferase n=1 Tax=Ignelater luminosus TaxID=2038154 RepID=A0A8K0CUY7_IGNLU|nr:hypothetical protein ILUMI_15301 [Ignelater luminosus]
MGDQPSEVKCGEKTMETGLTHECGVFGAIGSESWPSNVDIAQIVLIGLEALQHRGQESAGMVTTNGSSFHIQKGMGLVRNIFNNENMQKLRGSMGIGHTRYSTSAASDQVNCQPFFVHSMHGSLAVAHNGELINKDGLRKAVLERGVGLSTHSDSELITQALCLNPPEGEINGPNWPGRIKHLMQLSPLSYSFVIMLKDRIYAVRDPYGNRPLCLGKILPVNEQGNAVNDNKAEGWAVSSESCAFLTHIRYVREVYPGEIIEMTRRGITTIDIVNRPEGRLPAFCIFEYVYFARPNSIFEGQEVYSVRAQCGRQLAIEYPVDADIVGSVPESGNAAAHGYAAQANIPFGELLTKNTYVGRSFIQPTNRLRQLNVALKFSPIGVNLAGKRVILIDDSIVRGNTIGPIIKLLRRAGATEVHIRVASPPLQYPCYMGINIPTKEELIANSLDSSDLASHVGADSLAYLSVDGLVKAVQNNIKAESRKIGHCTACLTGQYPGGIPDNMEW